MEMQTVTVAERPDLSERAWEETIATIPEYNHHGDVINAYWGRLSEERPEFQFLPPRRRGDPRPSALAPAGLGRQRRRSYRRESTARSRAASIRAARTSSARC
jgi:hypothetical protein